jgi:hypothetical protein
MEPLTHVLLSVGMVERHDGCTDLPQLPVAIAAALGHAWQWRAPHVATRIKLAPGPDSEIGQATSRGL